MIYSVIITGCNRPHCVHFNTPNITVDELKQHIIQKEGLNEDEFYFTSKLKTFRNEIFLTSTTTFIEANFRIHGGKGGFGSLLRGQQTRVGQKKTTDFGACRDLKTGRRMRQIKNEQELREWYEKEKEREERKRREKAEKKRKEFEETTQKVIHDTNEKIREQEDVIRQAVLNGMQERKNKRKREIDGENNEEPSNGEKNMEQKKKKRKGKQKKTPFATEFDESDESDFSDE